MLRSDTHHSCQVCGRPWARFNYKALVCDNCRVFFFRKITLNRDYHCIADGNCEISEKARTNCSSCRFQRCLQAKMDPDEVGKRFDKRPVVPPLSKKSVRAVISQLHEPLVAYSCKVLPYVANVSSAIAFVNIMIDFERLTNNYTGDSPQSATARMDISLGEAMNNPSLCCQRDTAAFAELGSLPNLSSIPFWKIFCRTLTAYLDFIGGIEEIYKLDPLDKIKVCQYNLMDFVKYNLCYLQYFSRRKGCPFRGPPKFVLDGAPSEFWSSYPEAFGRGHRAVVSLMDEMSLDLEEAMFLKIIGMLSAPPGLSEKGQLLLIQAKEKYSIWLGELIRERDHTSSWTQVLSRVREILSIVPMVKEISMLAVQKQAEMVTHGYGHMQNQLAFDVHIRSY